MIEGEKASRGSNNRSRAGWRRGAGKPRLTLSINACGVDDDDPSGWRPDGTAAAAATAGRWPVGGIVVAARLPRAAATRRRGRAGGSPPRTGVPARMASAPAGRAWRGRPPAERRPRRQRGCVAGCRAGHVESGSRRRRPPPARCWLGGGPALRTQTGKGGGAAAARVALVVVAAGRRVTASQTTLETVGRAPPLLASIKMGVSGGTP